jgi:[phosphatase 2A protein]-leucine-carboxy methyltransferase
MNTPPKYDANHGSNDRPVMATADDAVTAKQAAVDAGYYDDPFLQAFSQAPQTKMRPLRQVQPIIKRGTHARVCVMDRALAAFLNAAATRSNSTSSSSSSSSSRQVVVLGAGKDTSYFRYCNQGIMGQQLSPNPQAFVKWYEVDHAAVIQEKARIMQSASSLSSQFPMEPTSHGYRVVAANDHSSLSLIQHDLRDTVNLLNKLELDPSLPTLLIIECVFMYLPSLHTRDLLERLAARLKHVTMVAYEPILGQDPFGRMMEQNLMKVGVATPDSCLLRDRTLDHQLDKFLHAGFQAAVACDMWSAYEMILTSQQRSRANRSEFLDEVEEWMLIMRHYCFLVARIGDASDDEEDMTRVGSGSPLGFASGRCERKTKT